MISRLFKFSSYFVKLLFCQIFYKKSQVYDLLYEAAQDLGGLYIKLIQFVCLRTELFPHDQKIRFLSFYDEVPPEKIDLQAVLEKELGSKKLSSFAHIEPKSFAAGSFAQVYRAQLLNGKNVIIKVKRKGLKNKLRIDFLVLKIFGKIFDLFYYQKLLSVPKLINEFKEISYKELDYRQELKNALYFAKVYANHPQVFIPKTYARLCSANVIVQDYVDGASLTDIIRLKSENNNRYQDYLSSLQIDIRAVMSTIAYEILYQGMVKDYFYADPHPGNIKILAGGRLAFIDFGILGKTPKNKRNYYHIFKLIVKKTDELDTANLGEEFLSMGASYFYRCMRVFDYNLLDSKKSISKLIKKSYQQILDNNRESFKEIEIKQEENFTQLIVKIMQLGERFGMQLPPELFAVMRSVVIFKAYHGILAFDHRPMRAVIKDVLTKVDSSQLINYEDLENITIPLEEAIETVLDTVSQVAEIDIPLYNKLSYMMQGAYA